MIRSLPRDEAHVYYFSLDRSPAERKALEDLLCTEERDRFARLVREVDRQRYMVARGMLRRLLSPYLECGPSSLEFALGEHGKPLCPLAIAAGFDFNLSHSGGWGAMAVARCPLGVDIEVLRDDVKVDAVAGRYFTIPEQATLTCLPPPEKPQQFFRLWTRKEAFLKGIGSGFSIRASSVSIEQCDTPLAVAMPVTSESLGTEPCHWQVRDLDLRPPLVGALATRGQIERVCVSDVE